MHSLFTCLLASLALCISCSPYANAPGDRASVVPSANVPFTIDASLGNRYTFRQGRFSFKPPVGWVKKEISGSRYIAFVNENSGLGFNPYIGIVEESYAGSLPEYMAINFRSLAKAFKGFKQIGQTDFKTETGVTGVVLEIEYAQLGKQLHQTIYIFEGSGGKKIVMACASLAQFRNETIPQCEASMRTFKFER